MDANKTEPSKKYVEGELYSEEIIIRPVTTTRTKALKITVAQRAINTGEIAMATAVFSKQMDVYYEKPDILEDQGMAMIYAARVMRRLNKKVKNG